MNKHERKIKEINEKVDEMTFGQLDTEQSRQKLWKSQYRTQLLQDYFIEEQGRATNVMKYLTIAITAMTFFQMVIAYLLLNNSCR